MLNIKELIKRYIQIIVNKLYPELKTFNQNIVFMENEISRCVEDLRSLMEYIDKKDPVFLRELDKKYLPSMFKKRLGYGLNLENPRTFNEKLQWLKIHYRKPEMSIMADKYKVREYLKARGFGDLLNELYGVYHDVDEIVNAWSELPESFVLKANHWSGGNIIIKSKADFNFAELEKLNELLKDNYYYRYRFGEWPYKNIEPHIIAEKYLEDETGGLLDYKVFCFNGMAKYIQVDIDRFTNHTRNYYNNVWEKQPFANVYPNYSDKICKPVCLDKMVSVAAELSQNLPHVRIDFYTYGNKLVFGEMTFTHEGGFGRFMPEEWDLKLGELIDLRS